MMNVAFKISIPPRLLMMLAFVAAAALILG
jgi:hypothetical protein